MATVGVRQLKSQTSEILRRVEDGEEIIVTRRGRPCAKLIAVPVALTARPGKLPTLRGILPELPDATWEDFMEAKKIWHRISDPKPLDE